MISRNFYIQLVLRIILMAMSSLAMAFAFAYKAYILAAVALILLVIFTITLVNFLNRVNRKLAYFFDAIRNEDFTLRFPEKDLIKSFKNLNHSLNRVNELIQEVYLKKQAQEQYYQEILKRAAIGVLTLNKKGHILFANPRMEQLLNHSPLNHVRQLEQIDSELYKLFASLKPFESKLISLTNERERTQLAIQSTSITEDKEELLLVVAQDIHKELEEKETDSWVRLIRVLTHEIMNTITPITSISGSILGYFKTPKGMVPVESFSKSHVENTVKGLEVIQDQGTGLMEFVQSYRSLLNVPAPDKSIVKALDLLTKVEVLMSQEMAKRKIAFSIECQPENLELFLDEKQVVQVLINLAKNAYQALEQISEPVIILRAGVSLKGSKFIEVSDNGSGIPDEIIDEIFVPFFTTKAEGTGIGLSLSKQVVQMHGGSLKIHSREGIGTTFILEF